MTEGFQGGTPGNGHDGDRPLERLIHPGSGRRKAPATRKGRQVEPETRAEIHALLGDRPRNRDLLIEFLHLLQDRYGHLSARHLAALAEEMKIAMAEVYEVASFYAAFDALVLPSSNEGTPVSVIEALAAERPVVATRVGGVPDVVRDGEDGFLVEAGETGDLADRLEQLARDPELRERMGRRGRERVLPRYAVERLVEDVDELYRSLLSAADVRRR